MFEGMLDAHMGTCGWYMVHRQMVVNMSQYLWTQMLTHLVQYETGAMQLLKPTDSD